MSEIRIVKPESAHTLLFFIFVIVSTSAGCIAPQLQESFDPILIFILLSPLFNWVYNIIFVTTVKNYLILSSFAAILTRGFPPIRVLPQNYLVSR